MNEPLETHREAVVRALERRFGRELAEDAVQDALEAALMTPDAGYENPKAWLHVVAHRRAVDALRREREAPHATPPETGAACDTADVVALRERVRTVLSTLRTIPGRQREALVLRSFEARSYAEIGARLEVDPDNAKQLVSRARRSLDAALTAEALDCARVRELLETAVGRGVRAPVIVGTHLRACRSCAHRHGELRRAARRRRLAALLPGPLLARLGEWGGRSLEVIAGTAAGGACAGVCAASVLSGLGAPAPVLRAVVTPPPAVTATPTATPAATRKARVKRTPTPVATVARPSTQPAAATPAPVATATATPAATATPPPVSASEARASARIARDLGDCHRAQDQACEGAVVARAKGAAKRFAAERQAYAKPPGERVPSGG